LNRGLHQAVRTMEASMWIFLVLWDLIIRNRKEEKNAIQTNIHSDNNYIPYDRCGHCHGYVISETTISYQGS